MTALNRVDFEIADNEDFRYAFQLQDTEGAALDLATATFKMDVRSADDAILLTLTTANGRVLVDTADNRIDLTVPAATIATLPAGVHLHDMLMVDAGAITRIWTGAITVVEGVTQ